MLKKQYRDAVRRLIAAEDALNAATKERDDALSAAERLEGFELWALWNCMAVNSITSDKLAAQPANPGE